jgi:hypothetical protein
LLLPVIWLVAERQQARTADSRCEWHTLVAVLLVLVRQMRTREGSGSPLDDTLSQRELPHSRHTGTLQLHALQLTALVRAVQATLSSTPILGAVYFTIGGLNTNEGRILARGQNALAHTVAVGSQPGAQWPYVPQTNYDWWNGSVPWIDDRQDAGVNAMNALLRWARQMSTSTR